MCLYRLVPKIKKIAALAPPVTPPCRSRGLPSPWANADVISSTAADANQNHTSPSLRLPTSGLGLLSSASLADLAAWLLAGLERLDLPDP